MWKELNLMNTHLGLIIIYAGLNAPFATFLIRSYMIQLPDELFDAAKIDGAQHIYNFLQDSITIILACFFNNRFNCWIKCLE